MSTGQLDDNPAPFSELSRILRSHPSEAEKIERLISTSTLSYRFDMPFVMGYGAAKSGATQHFYGDRHLPHVARLALRANGKESPEFKSFHIIPFLLRHEATEVVLQRDLSVPPERAHRLATAAEYHAVEDAGIDLPSYRKWIDKYVKADFEERLTRLPVDLDLTPFKRYHDAPSRRLLAHIESIIAKGKRSIHSWGHQSARSAGTTGKEPSPHA